MPLAKRQLRFELAGNLVFVCVATVSVSASLHLCMPISFEGWAAYLAFNVIDKVVGHVNVEITARPFTSRTAALFVNPIVYHALHHARWGVNFGFQGAGMDRALT